MIALVALNFEIDAFLQDGPDVISARMILFGYYFVELIYFA
jgi:hypothetical protein